MDLIRGVALWGGCGDGGGVGDDARGTGFWGGVAGWGGVDCGLDVGGVEHGEGGEEEAGGYAGDGTEGEVPAAEGWVEEGVD